MKIVLTSATTKYCSKCSSLLSYKKLRMLKLKVQNSIIQERQKNSLSLPPLQIQSQQLSLRSSLSPLLLPKFTTAYDDIDDRTRILSLDIENIDSSICLTTKDCVCIIGERKYTNAILMRLCVRALISNKEQDRISESTKKVIFIDAGGNNLDIYLCVNFARQYGLDIKKVLQSIIITRVFTIYQLANLIIYELPNAIQKLEAKVIVISDLLNMFIRDPQIEIEEEGEWLIKEIINSIRKISDYILVVVFLDYYHYYNNQKSSGYNKIFLLIFDKSIEITNEYDKNINSLLLLICAKIKNDNEKYSKDHNGNSH